MLFIFKNSACRNLGIVIMVFIHPSCRISGKSVEGSYVHQKFTDTLKLLPDNRYEYHEKLMTGIMGWTNGKWQINGNKIQLTCNQKPLVSYKLKLVEDSAISKPRMKILLSDSPVPVNIKEVKILKHHKIVSDVIYHKNSNIAELFPDGFDSILIATYYFKDLRFSNSINANHEYVARIYPDERLYELDKQFYKIKKKKLHGRLNDRVYTPYYFKKVLLKK